MVVGVVCFSISDIVRIRLGCSRCTRAYPRGCLRRGGDGGGTAIRLLVGVFGNLWGVLGKDMFEFLICREVALQFLREFLGSDLVVGYANWGG